MAPRKPVGVELRRLIGRAIDAPETRAVAPAWPDTFALAPRKEEAVVARAAVTIPARTRSLAPQPVHTRTAMITVEIAEPARAGSVAALPPVHARLTRTVSGDLRVGGDDLVVRPEPRVADLAVGVADPLSVVLAPEAVPRRVATALPERQARQVPPTRPPTVAAGQLAEDGPFLRLFRSRVPWDRIGTARLGANWNRVIADHGGTAGDLRLVGIYGPMALGLVAGIGVDESGRASIQLARRPMWGPVGDLAVARHEASGRLVSSQVSRQRPVADPAR
jgi:hypothetical protein